LFAVALLNWMRSKMWVLAVLGVVCDAGYEALGVDDEELDGSAADEGAES
jgi:hypothetical protein